MSLRGKVEIVGMTDVGRSRSHNEDYIAIDEELGLAVVADGMGGKKAGEVASELAVSLLSDELRRALPELEEAAEDSSDSPFSRESELVGRSVALANASIYQTAQSRPECEGMGTTVVAVLFYDSRFTVVHVGDSRLYRLHRGEFEQVTLDHSLVQELIELGFYTPQQARKSSNRNVVTRALGLGPEVEPDLEEEFAAQGDIFLLCSDGLNDMLEDHEIGAAISEPGTDLKAACSRLIEAANDRGGVDNISVVLARVVEPYPAHRGWTDNNTSWLE